MIRFALVTDSKTCLKFKEVLAKCAKDCQTQIAVDCFATSNDVASDYKSNWDVIIFDCNVKNSDCFLSAKYIRSFDENVKFCFVSPSPENALLGYSVQASCFWINPLHSDTILHDLRPLVKSLVESKAEFLKAHTEYGVQKLALDEIVYIESMNHRLIVHTKTAEYTLKSTMGAMEELLVDKGFFRCNQGYLVNLGQVKGIEGDFALVGNTKLTISRGKKKAFLNTYNDFVDWIA